MLHDWRDVPQRVPSGDADRALMSTYMPGATRLVQQYAPNPSDLPLAVCPRARS
jgi:hypothetical protein